MRAVLALVLVAACTPDIASSTYLCGPDGACPEGQACNGPDNRCVLASTAQPFACTPEKNTEPDDTAAMAAPITGLMCAGVAVPIDNCMLEGDGEDWVKADVPDCTNGVLTAQIDFPVAFERLAVEIWNLGTNSLVAEDDECPGIGEPGEERRCVEAKVTSGTTYGVRVRTAGDGDCDGNCAYNRYTLRVQLESSL